MIDLEVKISVAQVVGKEFTTMRKGTPKGDEGFSFLLELRG
jgi:hypothetical protein